MTELMRSSIVAAEAEVEVKIADRAVKNFRKRCMSCMGLIVLPEYTNEEHLNGYLTQEFVFRGNRSTNVFAAHRRERKASCFDAIQSLETD
jgi:hypothetical protein